MNLRVMIVDDEPPARAKIQHFLKDDPEIEVVAEAKNGLDALQAIEEKQPDLVFLDIQMPKMNGLEMITHLPQDHPPELIFTTAYDQYTLKAFDAHAVDYLLKPFDRERFKTALDRAKQRLAGQASEEIRRKELEKVLSAVPQPTEYLKRFLIKAQDRMYFVNAHEVDMLESSQKYIIAHQGKTTHLLRDTLNHLESRLDPEKFIRIHRSTIIRHEMIEEIQILGQGEYAVKLKTGTVLNVGKTYRDRLLES